MNNELKTEIENNFPGVEVLEVTNKKEKGIFKIGDQTITMSTWKFIKEQKEKLNIQKLDDLSTDKIDWKTEKLKRAEKQELERLQKVEEKSIEKLEITNRILHKSTKEKSKELEKLKQSLSEATNIINRKNDRIAELMEENDKFSDKINYIEELEDELKDEIEKLNAEIHNQTMIIGGLSCLLIGCLVLMFYIW